MIFFKNINEKTIVEIVKNSSFQLLETINLNQNYTFGIEIEFEGAALNSIKNIGKWKLEEELDISNKDSGIVIGGELISPILIDERTNWIDIDSKCKKLVKNGAYITNFTGGHIHIGSQIIGENSDNIRRFLKMWELFENIIYYFSYGYDYKPRKNAASYAKAIGKKLRITRTSKKGYTQFKNFYHWINYFKKMQDSKLQGINFGNFKGYENDLDNTIEIRCPNGSLDLIIWQNNINFFTRLLLKSHEENCDEELIDYLLIKKESFEYDLKNFNQINVDNVILLSDMLFDEDAAKINFLKQCLKLFNEKEKNKNHSL